MSAETMETAGPLFEQVLQSIGSAAAGTELLLLSTGGAECAFRVRETEDRCIDVMERSGRWWLCSSSTASGQRVVDAAFAYPGRSVDGFIAAAQAGAGWDGDGEPDGWDCTLERGRWLREQRVDLSTVGRTVVRDLVVATTRLAVPHQQSAMGPLLTHETVLRREGGTEALMSRRSSDSDAGDVHQLVVAMARRVLGPELDDAGEPRTDSTVPVQSAAGGR